MNYLFKYKDYYLHAWVSITSCVSMSWFLNVSKS